MGEINSTSSLGKIELIQLNHDNFITDVGQQIKSPYYHKIIYSPNRIFPLVQIQLAKYLNKWLNRKSCNLSLKHSGSLIFILNLIMTVAKFSALNLNNYLIGSIF
jgi:hypothetical protein